MGLIVKENNKLAVKKEVTEGTYEAPSAGDYVAIIDASLEPGRDLLDRNVLNGSLGKSTPRLGMTNATGSVTVEAKTSGTAGTEPEAGPLFEAAMGSSNIMTATVTSGTTHTTTLINVSDTSEFNVGDIVVVKESGAYHASPIASIVTDTSITLEIAAASAFSDSVVIEKSVNYRLADSGHPSLSITRYMEDAVREYITGAKISSMSLDNFAVGQIPTVAFGFEGLDYDRSVSAIGLTPTYDSSLPPVVLAALVAQDGTSVCVTNASISLSNGLAPVTCVAEASGKQAIRVANREISGSFNPYREDDSVANYTKFSAGTEFSLFLRVSIPGATGEYSQSVCVWLPNCFIESIAEGDNNGLVTDEISFRATKGSAGTEDEMVVAFI